MAKQSFFKVIIFLAVLAASIAAYSNAFAVSATSAADTCWDTDGQDYYSKGYVDVINGSDHGWDSCYDTNTLLENYCYFDQFHGPVFNHPRVAMFTCPNGCVDGACVPPIIDTCVDSDGGQNYYVFGSVDVGRMGYVWDYCSDSNTLVEQGCTKSSNGDVANYGQITVYNCPNGCSAGVCLTGSISSPTPAPEISVKVISPNGGETWEINSTKTISWSTEGISAVNPVKIVARHYTDNIPYSINYKDYVLAEMNLNDGLEIVNLVNIPVGIYTFNVKINYNNIMYSDWSDSYFNIVPAVSNLKVIYPNGGETITAGSNVEVSYINSLSGRTSVSITNCADDINTCNRNNYGGAIEVGNADQTIKKALVYIHSDALPGKYKAVITAVDPSSSTYNVATDKSDSSFNVVSSDAGSIIVSSPLDNSTFAQGDSIDIKWATSGAIGINAPVKVWLLKGYDAPILIKDSSVSTVASSEYKWTIPKSVFADPYNKYYIKVVSSDNIYISGSSGAFKVTEGEIPGDSAQNCLPDNTLIKLPNDPKVYVIINCEKKWIQTIEEFQKNNYSWSDVREDTTGVVDKLPNYAGAVNDKLIVDGSIIQVAGDPDVYIVKIIGSKKFKRLILSPSVFKSYGHLKWENLIKVDQAILDSYTTSNLVKSENGSIYKLVPDGDTGLRNHIKDMVAFQRLALDMDSVYQINTVDENSYEQGEELE